MWSQRDRLNTSHAAQLIDVNGTRHYLSADADGLYRFTDIPVGPAKLYLGFPNNPPGEVLFDATGATSAADIQRLPVAEYFGPQGLLEVTIDENGEERFIGMSALRLVANVVYADGTPAAGVGVELGSAQDWYPATEYDFPGGAGTYEAFQPSGYIRHLPGDLGVRVTAPAGYRVWAVTASNHGEPDITVTERDGAYWFSSTEAWNYFWNPAFTVTLEELPDTVRPQVALPDGAYTVKYNAQDLAGNISQTSSFAFTFDATAPKATIKDGAAHTVANGAGYDLISFKLSDAGKVDKVTLNGKVKDLTNNAWSDVNFIRPGTFGGVKGENTLVVYDVAGNTTTYTFILN